MGSKRSSLPCTVLWCEATSHPAAEVVCHRAVVGVFGGGRVPVRLVWAEHPDPATAFPPHVQIERLDASTLDGILDFSPDGARLLGEIIAALDPAEVLQFARALVDAAAVLDVEDGGERR